MIIKRIFMMICVLSLFITSVYSQSMKYGFTIGDKVNLRSEPTAKALIIRKLQNGEFLFCLNKTENKMKINTDENYWYNVKTLDNKSGWIFGKYYFDLFDSNDSNVLCKQIFDKTILQNEIIIINGNNFETRLYDIQFRKIDNTFYNLSYSYISNYSEVPRVIFGKCYLYEYINNKLYLRAHDGCYNININNDYIFCDNKSVIIAYKREVKSKKELDYKCEKHDTCNMYKITDSLNSSIYEDNITKKGSYLEFNPNTKNVTMYIKFKKEDPFQVIHYNFDNGKFVKVTK